MKSAIRHAFLYFMLIVITSRSFAGATCHGSFVNPITDVCWSCLFPITIGSATIVSGNVADTPNPSLPICACGAPVLHPGITTGFWEPVALTDVTRTPYCMVNLGGIQLSMGTSLSTGSAESANSHQNQSFYYVHWYVYPLLYWLKLITDGMCLETGDLDIAYLTELDPTWGDDEMTFLFNPEALMFGNLLAQAACAADSLASSVNHSLDALFWCAGSQGSMYPLNGHVEEHEGGVQASTLLSERMAYKLHRDVPLLSDSVSENSPALCYNPHLPIIPKSRYRYQMVNPVPTTGSSGCHPFGATTATWEAGHEIPFTGEDFGFLVWRKRACCAF